MCILVINGCKWDEESGVHCTLQTYYYDSVVWVKLLEYWYGPGQQWGPRALCLELIFSKLGCVMRFTLETYFSINKQNKMPKQNVTYYRYLNNYN